MKNATLSSSLGNLLVRGALLLSLAGASVAITDAAFASDRDSAVRTAVEPSDAHLLRSNLPREWTWSKKAVSFSGMYRK